MRFHILEGSLLVATLLAGCTGSKEKTETTAESQPVADATPGTDPATLPPEAPKPAAETPDPEAENRYQSRHDPAAFYTSGDVPQQGSYTEISFTHLSAQQLNRVMHRLKTETCTCGCPTDTIDECLVNDPQCGTAVTLANQVIGEEGIKKGE